MTMSPQTREQIIAAYKAMALDAHYRPMAPSDGFGTITVPSDELDLDAEAEAYVDRWYAEEDTGSFDVGVADFTLRPAMIYAIEAARLAASGMDSASHIAALMRLGLEHAERVAGQERKRG